MIKNYTCTILPVCVIKNCHFENKYLVEHKVYLRCQTHVQRKLIH